jgi:hypothetical protein
VVSGIAAVDLYENKLEDVESGLAVLIGLHEAGLSTLPVRERLARAAARALAWDRATSILEELMIEREDRAGRVEAARLAMAIYRDRLGTPARAAAAVEQLVKEAPDDGETLDLLLSGALEPNLTRRLLEAGREATVRALVRSPIDEERAARLTEIARFLDDAPLRQVALGALIAVGAGDPAAVSELSELDRRVATRPQTAIDANAIALIRDPSDTGPIAEMFALLSATLVDSFGPTIGTFGVTKKERIRPKDGLPVRDEIAAWAGALGIGEFEFYHGGREPDGIFGIPTETPIIVVGTNVTAPLAPKHRAQAARELLALRLGTNILRHRDEADVAALVVAACAVGGVRIASPAYAMLGEFERELGKRIPRRVRKALPGLARAVQQTGQAPDEWVRAAIASLDRMATMAVGDVSWVLSDEPGSRGKPIVSEQGRARAARLLSFVLSPAFFSVREQLGMGVR